MSLVRHRLESRSDDHPNNISPYQHDTIRNEAVNTRRSRGDSSITRQSIGASRETVERLDSAIRENVEEEGKGGWYTTQACIASCIQENWDGIPNTKGCGYVAGA